MDSGRFNLVDQLQPRGSKVIIDDATQASTTAATAKNSEKHCTDGNMPKSAIFSKLQRQATRILRRLETIPSSEWSDSLGDDACSFLQKMSKLERLASPEPVERALKVVLRIIAMGSEKSASFPHFTSLASESLQFLTTFAPLDEDFAKATKLNVKDVAESNHSHTSISSSTKASKRDNDFEALLSQPLCASPPTASSIASESLFCLRLAFHRSIAQVDDESLVAMIHLAIPSGIDPQGRKFNSRALVAACLLLSNLPKEIWDNTGLRSYLSQFEHFSSLLPDFFSSKAESAVKYATRLVKWSKLRSGWRGPWKFENTPDFPKLESWEQLDSLLSLSASSLTKAFFEILCPVRTNWKVVRHFVELSVEEYGCGDAYLIMNDICSEEAPQANAESGPSFLFTLLYRIGLRTNLAVQWSMESYSTLHSQLDAMIEADGQVPSAETRREKANSEGLFISPASSLARINDLLVVATPGSSILFTTASGVDFRQKMDLLLTKRWIDRLVTHVKENSWSSLIANWRRKCLKSLTPRASPSTM